MGDSGAITNGILNITIGTPTANQLEVFAFSEGVTINPPSARGAGLELTLLSNRRLVKYGDATASSAEEAAHIYVDRNVTLTATGGELTFTDGGSITDLNLSLVQGWNAVLMQAQGIVTENGYAPIASLSRADINNLSSNLRWVIDRN